MPRLSSIALSMCAVLLGFYGLPASTGFASGIAPLHADPYIPAALDGHENTSTLPTAWCGEARATDDRLHEAGSVSVPKIKVVEAIPSDGVPRSDFHDVIQAQVGVMIDHLGRESGERKSLRFDLGTTCGPRYVDVQTIRLPLTAEEYGIQCNPGQFDDHVHQALGLPHPLNRKYLVYGPDVECYGASGLGEMPWDDRPGPQNSANTGGHLAMVFYPEPSVWTALHEIGHILGAVQTSAPHSDGAFHCWDSDDIMCYPYTEFLVPQSAAHPCESPTFAYPFDCGKDDYFNPAPAPGSYLATHWNLYDSVFLCPLTECAPSANAPPVADFALESTDVTTGDEVRLSSQAGDAEGPVVEHRWEFGDGSTPATGAEVTHVFNSAGTYVIRLVVKDEHGATAEATREVVVAQRQTGSEQPATTSDIEPSSSISRATTDSSIVHQLSPPSINDRRAELRAFDARLAPTGTRRLRHLLGRGVAVTIYCSEACGGSLVLTISRRRATQLRLATKIARAGFTLPHAGARKLKLRANPSARRALVGVKDLAGTLTLAVKDRTGNPTRRQARVVLIR